jgi:transposase InsO family protein
MRSIYKIARVSKQAAHKYFRHEDELSEKLLGLLIEADELKEEHPGCGVEKMYQTLKPKWLGRDKFITLFMQLGYRVRIQKNYQKTTIPVHSQYKNLIQGLMVQDRNIVWQTDITYFRILNRYYYIVFIIDVYTKMILGYKASDNLRAEANMVALRMALKNNKGDIGRLIHHSDKGSQYIYAQYVDLLNSKGIMISMGDKAQDNAYAERINGTIKNEYLKYWEINSLSELQKKLTKAVNHYNNKRIHNELPGRQTPLEFNKSLLDLESQRRPTVIIYAEGNYKIKAASSRFDFKPKREPLAHNCPIEVY